MYDMYRHHEHSMLGYEGLYITCWLVMQLLETRSLPSSSLLSPCYHLDLYHVVVSLMWQSGAMPNGRISYAFMIRCI
jgi:hypothetical protein